MKVTVYGGTNNKHYTSAQKSACDKLGKYLGSIKADVLTGACRGFPYFVGKTAAQHGSRVYGYSPALDLQEHIDRYKFPTDGVTDLVFSKTKYDMAAESFMQRSIEMTPFSDVVIAMGGSWGTYFELLLSFFYKRTIVLVEEFGGAVEAFNNTYDFFGSRDVNEEVHFGANIIRVKNVAEAIKTIESLRK